MEVLGNIVFLSIYYENPKRRIFQLDPLQASNGMSSR